MTTITWDLELIQQFFTTVLGQSKQVTAPVTVWIDEVDASFQQLACYTNTPEGRTSAIWRTVTKHTALHAGLNTLVSLQAVAGENLLERALTALTSVLTGMFERHTQYIGSEGSIVQGWTQAWRLCQTQWDLPALEDPAEQEPDEDDEDDWLPRYEIFTRAGTGIGALRGLEHALGGGGSELATQDGEDSLIMGYVVDLNIMQATLPLTTSFVNWTLRFVWDGNEDDSDSAFDITPSDMSFFEPINPREALAEEGLPKDDMLEDSRAGSETATTGHRRQAPWNEYGHPDPVGNSRQRLTPAQVSNGHFLKSLSQQKGENPDSIDYHTYESSRGEGSWIFIVDCGYTLDHSV